MAVQSKALRKVSTAKAARLRGAVMTPYSPAFTVEKKLCRFVRAVSSELDEFVIVGLLRLFVRGKKIKAFPLPQRGIKNIICTKVINITIAAKVREK